MQRSLQEWQGEPVTVTYRAFFLNPDVPPDGYDFRAYLLAKFGKQRPLEHIFDGPRRMGAASGLVFNFEKIQKAPNTQRSHVLIALAPASAQEALIEDVYAAYFEHGQDIGDIGTLVEIGARHGLQPEGLPAALENPAVQAQVRADVQRSYQLGIRGVPYFVINEKYAFSGAQPPEVILGVLRQVMERET